MNESDSPTYSPQQQQQQHSNDELMSSRSTTPSNPEGYHPIKPNITESLDSGIGDFTTTTTNSSFSSAALSPDPLSGFTTSPSSAVESAPVITPPKLDAGAFYNLSSPPLPESLLLSPRLMIKTENGDNNNTPCGGGGRGSFLGGSSSKSSSLAGLAVPPLQSPPLHLPSCLGESREPFNVEAFFNETFHAPSFGEEDFKFEIPAITLPTSADDDNSTDCTTASSNNNNTTVTNGNLSNHSNNSNISNSSPCLSSGSFSPNSYSNQGYCQQQGQQGQQQLCQQQQQQPLSPPLSHHQVNGGQFGCPPGHSPPQLGAYSSAACVGGGISVTHPPPSYTTHGQPIGGGYNNTNPGAPQAVYRGSVQVQSNFQLYQPQYPQNQGLHNIQFSQAAAAFYRTQQGHPGLQQGPAAHLNSNNPGLPPRLSPNNLVPNGYHVPPQFQQQHSQFHPGLNPMMSGMNREPILNTMDKAHMVGAQLGFGSPIIQGSPAGTGSITSPSRDSDSSDDTPLSQLSGVKRTAQAPVKTGGKKPKSSGGKKKKKKDPNEPQKPVSAYALFFRDTQAAIKNQNPNATFGEVSKIVASMWDSLDDETKSNYKKRTEVAKKEYLKQLAAYRASLVSAGQLNPEDLGNHSIVASDKSPPQTQSPDKSPPQQQGMAATSSNSSSGATTSASPPLSHMGTTPLSHPPAGGGHVSTSVSSDVARPSSNDGCSTAITGLPPPQHGHLKVMSKIGPGGQRVMVISSQGGIGPQGQQPQPGQSLLTPIAPRPPHMGGPSPSPQQGMDTNSFYNLQGQSPGGMVHHSNGNGGVMGPPAGPPMSMCVRQGCEQSAVAHPNWDNEYCSNDCVVDHCRDVFTAWVASRQAPGSTYASVK